MSDESKVLFDCLTRGVRLTPVEHWLLSRSNGELMRRTMMECAAQQFQSRAGRAEKH